MLSSVPIARHLYNAANNFTACAYLLSFSGKDIPNKEYNVASLYNYHQSS